VRAELMVGKWVEWMVERLATWLVVMKADWRDGYWVAMRAVQ
jgi:hypothetical protein